MVVFFSKIGFQAVKHQTCEVLKVHKPVLHSVFTLAPDLSFDCLCILGLLKSMDCFAVWCLQGVFYLNVKLEPEILHEALDFGGLFASSFSCTLFY